MEQITWDEYYKGFFNRSLREPLNKPSAAERQIFCPSRAVPKTGNTYRIPPFSELSSEPKSPAAGVRFTPDHVPELTVFIDKPLLSKTAEQASVPHNREQPEEIHMLIGDASFARISNKAKIVIFADDASEKDRESRD